MSDRVRRAIIFGILVAVATFILVYLGK